MQKFRASLYSDEMTWLRHTLTARRLHLGLTQTDVAKQVGTLTSLISKIENGERRLDVLEFIRYCDALSLNPADLITVLQQQLHDNHPADFGIRTQQR